MTTPSSAELNNDIPTGNGSKSLCEAVVDKYVKRDPVGDQGEIYDNCRIKVGRVRTTSGGSGSDGETSIPIPPYIVLDNSNIESVGNVERLCQLCTDVMELDLASNRLDNLAHLIELLQRLPKLQFCNLSCNPLADVVLETGTNGDEAVRSVRRLVLNNTSIQWASLYTLLKVMVGVEELHLSLNDYGTVEECTDPSLGSHPTLKVLHFNRNGVDSWAELDKLGRTFPNLETLVVAENARLDHVGAQASTHFGKLKSLNISKTGISGWEAIDRLCHFPSLLELRIQSVPLLADHTPEERRFLMIARLPAAIKRLNGSTISPEERFSAERSFIRYYMQQADKPQQYHRLSEKHGPLNPLVQLNLDPVLEVSCLVKYIEGEEYGLELGLGFKVRVREEEEGEEQQYRQKLMKIRLKQTVAQFKQSLANFAGVPASQLRVFYLDRGADFHPQEMKLPSKFLYTYKISNEDEFLVMRKTLT